MKAAQLVRRSLRPGRFGPGVVLAVMALLVCPGCAPGPSTTGARWLMVNSLVRKLDDIDRPSATAFFDTPGAFTKSSVVPGFSAQPIASYTSYAQFSRDLADGAYPSADRWVMFGLEKTTDSPVIEKQHPGLYLQKFATLAHRHHLKVMEVPGLDVVDVPGAACTAARGEPIDQAYLRCRIPAAGRDANIFLIQAQGVQPDAAEYARVVSAAAAQLHAVAPHVTVMSGLTTDRGDSAASIVACWRATHAQVAGYWMNSTSATLAVAAQALNKIRQAGGA